MMENRYSLRPGLPLAKRLWLQSRPGDWLIIFLFFALAAGSFRPGGWFGANENAAENPVAAVTVGNHEVTALSLAKPIDLAVQGARGEITLQVQNRRIRVLRSTCPNQVCVRQGAVCRPGEMLVCVPNRLIVLIRGTAQPAKFKRAPADSTGTDKPASDYDAVTY